MLSNFDVENIANYHKIPIVVLVKDELKKSKVMTAITSLIENRQMIGD